METGKSFLVGSVKIGPEFAKYCFAQERRYDR